MKMRKVASPAFIVSCMAIVLATVSCGVSYAEPKLVYSQDWSDGNGGWSVGQSLCPGGNTPKRIHVGHSLAEYVLMFDGQCGWGMKSKPVPRVPLKISITALAQRSNRNALSVNVRGAGSAQIYKYSFGGGGYIIANNQPPDLYYRNTDLTYDTGVPYELYSIWIPDGGYYLLGIKNLLTGEDTMSARRWWIRNDLSPAWIDIDQEGGQGPVALGRVDVYLGQ